MPTIEYAVSRIHFEEKCAWEIDHARKGHDGPSSTIWVGTNGFRLEGQYYVCPGNMEDYNRFKNYSLTVHHVRVMDLITWPTETVRDPVALTGRYPKPGSPDIFADISFREIEEDVESTEVEGELIGVDVVGYSQTVAIQAPTLGEAMDYLVELTSAPSQLTKRHKLKI